MDMALAQTIGQQVNFEAEEYLVQQQMGIICDIQRGNITEEQGMDKIRGLKKIQGRLNTAEKNIIKLKQKHAVHMTQRSTEELENAGKLIGQLFMGQMAPDIFCDEIKNCVKRLSTFEKNSSSSVKTENSGTVLSFDKLVERKPFCFPDFQTVLTMQYHEILYKEQKWPVERRDIVYDVQFMKIKGDVTNTLRNLYSNEDKRNELINLFRKGKLFMYKIHTNESIPNGGAIVGYIELRVVNNKIQKRIIISDRAMQVNSMVREDVENKIRAGVKQAKALMA